MNNLADNFLQKLSKPPTSKISLIKRRLKQLSQVLFSNTFRSEKEARLAVTKKYGSKQEVEFYTEYALVGLHSFEIEAIQSLAIPVNADILVLGCGAGREAFAMEKLNSSYSVWAVDSSEEMAHAAQTLALKKQSKVKFSTKLPGNLNKKFDFIWLSASLENHILSSKGRVCFFSDLKKCLKPNGRVLLLPLIQKFSPKGRHYWSSKLLKIKWAGRGEWQEGDTVQSNFGAHSLSEQLIYLHYYQSEKDYIEELKLAELMAYQLLGSDFWLAEPEVKNLTT